MPSGWRVPANRLLVVPVSPVSLVTAVITVFLTFSLIACPWVFGRAVQAQSRGGAVGPVGRVAVPRPIPRVVPVVPVMPAPFSLSRRPVYFFRPIFPVLVRPGVGLFGGPALGVPAPELRPFWNKGFVLSPAWDYSLNLAPT
jgi:hypothetical protein